jgi:hypothetical protein
MFSTLRLRLWQPCLLFLCLVLTAGVFSTPVRAVSAKAGMVIFVSRNAMAESAGTTRSLALRSPIFVGDVIKTDATGSVQILFDDDSILALAEEGEVTINRFVYNGTGSSASGTTSVEGEISVENKSSAPGASGSDGGSSEGSSAFASGGALDNSSAPASGSGSGASGTDDSSASTNMIVNAPGGTEGSSASASGGGTSISGTMGNSPASTANGGIGASGDASVMDGGASGGMPGGMAGGAGGVGGRSDGAGGMPSASDSGDGLRLTVGEGSAAFGSGDACRNGCEVVTLVGSAGIGGKDEKILALNDRSMGSGVMVTVTASAQTRSSTISAVAVAPNMQVTISGAGLAAQTLAQNSMARLGDGMANVSALDTGNLQSQMQKMAFGSAVPSSTQLAATTRSMAAANLISKDAGALSVSRSDALGNALATPQAKAVGVANTSASMNVNMTAALGLTGGNTATLTRQTVSSTVDFSGNKLLSYDSVSTLEIANAGVSQGQVQVDVTLKDAVNLNANAIESALTQGRAINKITDISGGSLAGVAGQIKSKVDSGDISKTIIGGGIAGRGR